MNKNKQSGFTLVELMILLAIVGVVSAIGIPSFRAMVVSNELVDTANSLRMSMKLARSEAVARGKNAIVCSSVNIGNAGAATCSQTDGDWAKGWIVGIDLDGNGNIQESLGELLWAHEMDATTKLSITPSNPAFNQDVTYSYTGWITAGAEAGFDICSGYGATAGYPRREIRASIAGGPQLTKNLVTRC
ncbi:MAG: GspH/FimT family pseudopilin [Gammaproteobacteria bacterium]|nr:GspH/FimT family pseudopilin [Gammaproteobacteria bacterium]